MATSLSELIRQRAELDRQIQAQRIIMVRKAAINAANTSNRTVVKAIAKLEAELAMPFRNMAVIDEALEFIEVYLGVAEE